MSSPNITTIDATTTVMATVVVPPSPIEDVTEEAATKTHEETPEEREQRILTLTMLARQLEYYFSAANLSRDTYLSTLRDLNDSYVPVSIIANFGKVQALVPYESALEAVVVAATDHSDLLEIVELDEVGKKIKSSQEEKKDESETTTIIVAVGSISQQPIPMSQIQPTEKTKQVSNEESPTGSSPSSTANSQLASTVASAGVQNTIILRDVAEDMEEKTLRDLFNFEGCPSVETVREDLHNCWFVTLDTESKDDMFNVMMKLRTTKYPSGDSVKARLKSSASANSSSTPTPNNIVFNPNISTMFSPQFSNNGNMTANSNSNGNNHSRKKRSSNNKGRSSSSAGTNTNNKPKSNQQSMSGTSKRRNGKDESSLGRPPFPGTAGVKVAGNNSKKIQSKPPSMGESNFPSLPLSTDGNSKPCQVEKVPTDHEMMRGCEKERNASGFSDSSSTATTSTASTPTEAPPSGVVSGGYAAALLKPAAPTPVSVKQKETKVVSQQQSVDKGKESSKKKDNKKSKDVKLSTKNVPSSESISVDLPAVSVQPPAWGKGRSFADIVSA
ncbi:unnamed protein product [Pseudo-nitzschia multistriata]|uniref:HTH La-type RNA-binding domain-containing protein n=1 Tax=Pseudo-nitzschia multistriata TaxID=183589 RepID=A0A448Z9G1_9STRA|nr:unnamed protein product [Pseudo-nitzschia multistriata]